MTDTPRTDAFAISDCPGDIVENWMEFARRLEREHAVLRGTIRHFEHQMNVRIADCDKLRAALELADKELEASGYGNGTLPRKAIAEALYG